MKEKDNTHTSIPGSIPLLPQSRTRYPSIYKYNTLSSTITSIQVTRCVFTKADNKLHVSNFHPSTTLVGSYHLPATAMPEEVQLKSKPYIVESGMDQHLLRSSVAQHFISFPNRRIRSLSLSQGVW